MRLITGSTIANQLKKKAMPKIRKITNYKGRFCAELENGKYVLSNGTFELLLCEKVPEGMKIIKNDIVGGKMMKSQEDFCWCVENMNVPEAEPEKVPAVDDLPPRVHVDMVCDEDKIAESLRELAHQYEKDRVIDEYHLQNGTAVLEKYVSEDY